MQLELTDVEKKEWKDSIEKYAFIMQRVNAVDVSKDADFQRVFNGFYKVRRNEEWRNSFYDLFEKSKSTEVEYKNIITEMYNLTGQVEASFSSKLVATLNPNMPIWDQYVLKNLGIEPIKANDRYKLPKSIQMYDKIARWYKQFSETAEAEEYIKAFDEMFPEYEWVSSTKKIDFFLWKTRG